MKQSRQKKLKQDYLPVLKRMQLNADFLRLCFILSGKKIWFQIDPHTGIIEPLNGETGSPKLFHFALKRVGKGWGAKHRGRHDILFSFVKNALAHCSEYDPVFQNNAEPREIIWEKLDELANKFLKKLDQSCVNKARKASNRYAIAWEIYGILRTHSPNSMAVLQLNSFIDTFPSLLKISYPGFLSTVVVCGKPLRKTIPYWSKSFRKQAQKPPQNYMETITRLMKAVAVSLGARQEVDEQYVFDAIVITRFTHPFRKRPRFKESYLVWMLKQADFTDQPFRSWYDYIEASQHVVNRYTTFQSLERRHAQWVREQLEKTELPFIDFPRPWLEQELDFGDYRICYITDSIKLSNQAIKQENCVKAYFENILVGSVQLYSLNHGNEIAGTIQLLMKNGRVFLGQCAGYRNSQLTREQMDIVRKWFLSPIHSDQALKADRRNPYSEFM